MLPTRTVENYLKAIFHAQLGLGSEDEELVPMGQLAMALGVVPGTATTMVKALAEAGLARYEPYVGVRLTAAGEKLAAMVLRRHRLIELFLVQVMGMSWAEVHDEAEQLEHAVSDALIERIDDMLGHPAVDPHGDPIPGPEGTVRHQDYHSLLTCPLHTSVVVTRVTDQDPSFLRFAENNELKPGEPLEIEARDAAADSVQLRGKDERRITIGMRAASKVLVEVAKTLALCLLSTTSALAQPDPVPAANGTPFEILDNSYFVEEGFNQEPGIFQNIFGIVRDGSGWEFAFTQEWPVRSQAHQLSYTIPVADVGVEAGIGDVMLNYRYQAMNEGPGRPAFAPRLSAILPSGNESRGLGDGVVGWQVNLPFSKQRGDMYFHWNGGFTFLPRVSSPDLEGRRESLVTPHLGASAIWRTLPMLHLMLESVVQFDERFVDQTRTGRTASFTLSPGIRGGWNRGDHQIIVGLAIPTTFEDSTSNTAAFGYFSYELPFVR
jgi:DtxR family Mn-dependent transcriptional regulator